jgi:hypothetical protein
MAKIPLYLIDPETGERIEKKLDDSKASMLPELVRRGWKRVEEPAATAEAAPAPAAAAPAAAAPAAAPFAGGVSPEKEEGFLRSMEALLTGAGRGVTADFLDEIAGTFAAAGGQIGGRLAGVPSEFLAQEDFYTQGREEEQARQEALQKESPLLTMGGQILGTLPFAAAAPGGATTLAGRFAQAAPAAAAYGVATGVGRTDIRDPNGPSADVPLDLAKNIGIDVGAGLIGAGGGAVLGTAASRAREAIARKLADIGKEADKARVLTAGKKALEEVEKPGRPGVEETARYMRATEMGGVQSPIKLAERAAAVEKESGSIIGRILGDVDEASGGLMKKAQEARAQASQMSEQIDSLVVQKQATADEARRLASVAADKLERARENQMQASMRGPKRMTRDQAARLLAGGVTEDMDPAIIAEARGVLSAPMGAPTPSAGADYNKYLAGLKADADEALKKADEASRAVIAARNTDEAKIVADLSKQADELEAQAAKRKVSAADVAGRMRAAAETMRKEQGETFTDPLLQKTYTDLMKYADEFASGGDISLKQAQKKLESLGVVAKYEKGAADLNVPAAARAAREQNRALREAQATAATEAFPSGSMAQEGPYARIGRGGEITAAPTGGEALQSTRRAYQVAKGIKESAKKEAERIEAMPSFDLRSLQTPLAKAYEAYKPSITASMYEKAKSMAPEAGTALLGPQERLLASLPYGAESFADMIRQIDEEAAR